MADSTLSNSRNILTASSSGTSAIWEAECVFVFVLLITFNETSLDPSSQISHLKNDTFHHFAVFLALFLCLSLQVFIHLSSAHHVLQNKHILYILDSVTWL